MQFRFASDATWHAGGGFPLSRKRETCHRNVITTALDSLDWGIEGLLEAHQQGVAASCRWVWDDVGIAVTRPEGINPIHELPRCPPVVGLVEGVVCPR